MRSEFLTTFNRCREIYLDSCQGRCLLRRPELAMVVASALLHFDGEQYHMGDFVVMPNHVHLLAVFTTSDAMKRHCASWMHFAAVRINRLLGQKGRFWQQDAFDHLVRSPEQYAYLRNCIESNPKKAALAVGEYYYRKLDS